MASQEPSEVITIPDDVEEEEEDDWPESGPVNLQEAKAYSDHINDVFDSMAEVLHNDNKDALPKCIRTFKKLIAKDWHSMTDTDPEVVIRDIYDMACIYLFQHITKGGIDIVVPDEEPPSGRDFVRELPEINGSRKSWSLSLGFSTAPVRPTHILLWLLLI